MTWAVFMDRYNTTWRGFGWISPQRAVELGREKDVLKYVKTTLKRPLL